MDTAGIIIINRRITADTAAQQRVHRPFFPLFTYHFYLKGTKTTSSQKSLYVPLEKRPESQITLTVVYLHASSKTTPGTTFTVGKQKIKTS